MMMNDLEKLQESIRELEDLTGLTVEIRADSSQDTEETVRKIRSLSRAYRNENQLEYVIRAWMTGHMDAEEFFAALKRKHISRTGHFIACLIRFNHDLYPEISLVLKNIISDSRAFLIPCSDRELLVLLPLSGKGAKNQDALSIADHPENQEAYSSLAMTRAEEMIDALGSELMEPAVISLSSPFSDLDHLPAAYEEARLSLEVGRMFYPDRAVWLHDRLDIGRLVFHIPQAVCQDYIREKIGAHFLEKPSPVFDSDILHTGLCFLDNNLNIAETARQLHVHRNTLLYRLEQIEKETGLDIRNFDQAMTYRMCGLILRYIHK